MLDSLKEGCLLPPPHYSKNPVGCCFARFTYLSFDKAVQEGMGEIHSSQSPPVSPRKHFPAAPKRKKLLESGFENEAGNEKERREGG
jgi:hypothetical protein